MTLLTSYNDFISQSKLIQATKNFFESIILTNILEKFDATIEFFFYFEEIPS